MAAGPEPFYELKCSCNQYPWGKTGQDSLSATLCAKGQGYGNDGPKSDFKLDEKTPYAEMWMGTYPVLPSYIRETGEDLQDVLDMYPKQLIGEYVVAKFGHSKIPYLPKVLSIAKALPLQVHPNTELSSKLHQQDPQSFTDPNHKPEIALALGKFEAFCGWKPLARISRLMKLECLKPYLPSGAKADIDDQTLKAIVRNMLEADDKTIKSTYKGLTALSESDTGKDDIHVFELAPRLAEQYSEADPGILVALITMNYLVLQAGEGIYIPADGIHAYLSGDIIECMARSNNVINTGRITLTLSLSISYAQKNPNINTGFCPRAERGSAELFTSTLTFSPHNYEECMLRPQPFKRAKNGKTEILAPPMSEFNMLQVSLERGEKETIDALKGPGIFIATKGGASMKANGKQVDVKEGHVVFIAQGVELEFEAGRDGLLLHEAYVE